MRPLDIQHIGKELAVKWDDGGESFIPLERLRTGVTVVCVWQPASTRPSRAGTNVGINFFGDLMV